MPRAGWNSALEQRWRSVPRKGRLITEMRIEGAGDIKQRADQWTDADGGLSANLETLADGGLRLKPTAGGAVGPTTVTSSTTFYRSKESGVSQLFIDPLTNLDGTIISGALVGLQLKWLGAASTYGAAQAWLNPQYDPAKPSYVQTWEIEIFEVVKTITIRGTPAYQLVPVLRSRVPKASGVAAWVVFPFQDATGKSLLFRPKSLVPGGAHVDPLITSYVVLCHGYDAQGKAATNIGWGYDSGNTTFASGTFNVTAQQVNPFLGQDAGLVGLTNSLAPKLCAFQLVPVSVAATATATYLGAPITLSPNLIDNPDFETDIVGMAATGGSTVVRSSTQARHGTWATKVTTANASDSGLRVKRRAFSAYPQQDDFPATAGLTYDFQPWIYAPAGSVGKTLKCVVAWLTGADGDSGISVTQTVVTLVAGWQRVQVKGTAPATTNTINLYVVTDTTEGVFDYWVDIPQLGLTPTIAPELVARSEVPTGTSALFEILADDGTTWKTFADGDIVGSANAAPSGSGNNLTAVGIWSAYSVRVTLNANAATNLTPIIRSEGARVVAIADLRHLADVVSWDERLDAITHISEVGETVLRVIRDGARDFRDKITELLSQNVPGQLYYRIYAAALDLPRSLWCPLDDFIIEDTDPRAADIGITGVSTLAQLRQALPKLASDVVGAPNIDVSNAGSWTASSGQTIGALTHAGVDMIADLSSLLNSGTPDDTTYVESPNNPSTAEMIVGLPALGAPLDAIPTQVQLQMRAAVAAGGNSVSLKIELRQGATVKATLGSFTVTTLDTGQGSYTPYSYGLTVAEVVSITDWANLNFRITATGTGKVRLGWCRLVQLGTRADLVYPSAATPAATAAACLDDLIQSQVALDGRYRGPKYIDLSPAIPAAKVIEVEAGGATDLTRALQEIQAIDWIVGGAHISNQGRIEYIPLYQTRVGRDPISGDVIVGFGPLPGGSSTPFIPAEEIIPISTTPGWRQRIGSFAVPWGWNGQSYAGEANVQHQTALVSFPPALIDTQPRAPEIVAKWLGTGGMARALALRHVQAFAFGLLEWRFRTTYARPEWKLGEIVAIGVENFVAFDPIATRALAGSLVALGMLVGKWDGDGYEWSVWMQTYGSLTPIPQNQATVPPLAVPSNFVLNGDVEDPTDLLYWGPPPALPFAFGTSRGLFILKTYGIGTALNGRKSLIIYMDNSGTRWAWQTVGPAQLGTSAVHPFAPDYRYVRVTPGATITMSALGLSTLGTLYVGVAKFDANQAYIAEELLLTWASAGPSVLSNTYVVAAGVYYVVIIVKFTASGASFGGGSADDINMQVTL